MTDRELMQWAYDAIEPWMPGMSEGSDMYKVAIALNARLAQPDVPETAFGETEPVAYGVLDDDGQIDWTAEYPFSNEPGWPDSVPLYTAPPQREWVGLTDEEKVQVALDCDCISADWVKVVETTEAKLKAKNV